MSLPEKFSAYKEIHHGVRDGKLVTMKKGVYAAAARIDQVKGISEEERAEGKRHLEKHYHEMGEKAPWESKDDKDNESAAAASAGATPPRAEEPMADTEDMDQKNMDQDPHAKTHAMLDEIKTMLMKDGEHHATTHQKLDDHGEMLNKLCAEDGMDGGENMDDESMQRVIGEVQALAGKTPAEAGALIRGWAAASAQLGELFAQLGVDNFSAARGALDSLLDAHQQVSGAATTVAQMAKAQLITRIEAEARGAKPRLTPARRDKMIADVRAGRLDEIGFEAAMKYAGPVLPQTVSESVPPPPAAAAADPLMNPEPTADELRIGRLAGMTDDEIRSTKANNMKSLQRLRNDQARSTGYAPTA